MRWKSKITELHEDLEAEWAVGSKEEARKQDLREKLKELKTETELWVKFFVWKWKQK